MKVYCPQIHSACEDGFPQLQDDPCVFWDHADQACLMAESARRTYLGLRQFAGEDVHPRQQRAVDPDEWAFPPK